MPDQASEKLSLKRGSTPLQAAAAVALGSIVTLCLYGYQFGRGNHAVYLLDAIHRADPSLLASDWFTTQTLQYHIAFTWLTSPLMKLGIAQPVFLIIYLLLVILFHVALRGIVRQLGGTDGAYLLAVVVYYLSAAGTGLGAYQFFQDSSLLPSNIASVAMLWGIGFWISGRSIASGVCFGIAGLFHLNYALAGSVLWLALAVWKSLAVLRSFPIAASVCALGPSLLNIALAARSKLTHSGAMSLSDFIDLYVRLRHPHHYDLSTWPIGLWIAFLWTVVPALLVLRSDARRIVVVILGMLIAALLGAGVWYTNETLVQMSLYRFSVFVQLLGCCAASVWIDGLLNRKRISAAIGLAGCAGIVAVCLVRGPFFGLFQAPRDSDGYVELCHWVSQNTPVDAIVLVPPNEESMRTVGRRAIVVNFKAVPQLSGELIEWRRRMCEMLDLPDLNSLPREYSQTLKWIGARYKQLSIDQLLSIARKVDARYIVVSHPLEIPDASPVFIDASRTWMVYDLGHGSRGQHR